MVTVEEVLNFNPGDVIPIDMPDTVRLMVKEIPVCYGKLGVSDGRYAIQVTERVKCERGYQLPVE